jgi:hypothetical protein
MSEDKEFVSVGEIDEADDEVEAKRSDNAQRQARFRARRDLELDALTVKKKLRLIAARCAALSATIKAAEEAKARLTPEQKAIWESEDLKEGLLPDGLTAPFSCLCSMMHRTVAAVKMDSFDEIRGDIELAIYNDYIETFPWSKKLVYPHRNCPDIDDPEGPLEFTMREFFDAVNKWTVYRNHTPAEFTLPDEEPPVKRKRGRPKKTESKTTLMVTAAIDPAVVASWSQPPGQPQKEYWGGIAADRAGREVARDVEDALPSKPVVFFRQNEQ